MKNSSSLNINLVLISVILLMTPLVYSNQLLDSALNFRFFILSILSGLAFGLICYNVVFNSYALIMFVYFCVNLVSFFWANCFSEAIFESLRVVQFLLCYLLFFNFLINYKSSRCLLIVSVLSAILILTGWYQLIELNIIDSKSLYSIVGFQNHKNLFSSFLFLLIPFNVVSYIKFKDSHFRFLFGLCVLMLVSLILILQTRAVYVGLLGSIITLFVLGIFIVKQNFIKPIIAIFVLASLLCLGLYSSKQYFKTKNSISTFIKSDSNNERLELIKRTFSLIKENPILGVGAGNWQVSYSKYNLSGLNNAINNTTFQRPHNDFLWILSELGLIGFTIYMAGILYTIYKSYVFLKSPNENKLEVIIYLSFYIGFLLISFLDFPKERIEHLVLNALILANIHFIVLDKARFDYNYVYQPIKIILFGLILLSVYVGYKRFEGEKCLVGIYRDRANNNWNGLIEKAEAIKSPFYTLDPTSMPIDWYVGVAYFSKNENEKAFQSFSRANEISPYNFHVLNNLASTYENLGNSKKAIQYYNEALRINPYFDEAKLNLSAVYFNENHVDKAIEILHKCLPSLRKEEYLKICKESLSSPISNH